MTDQALYARLDRRRKATGMKRFTPHDLRRTYSSGMIDAGADVLVVQKLLGHAHVSTTSRYDMRDEAAKRRAVELFHVPYVQFSELAGGGQPREES